MKHYDAVVVGAGPYGLSTALRAFGPLVRLATGCTATAPRVAGSIARRQRTFKSVRPRAIMKNVVARAVSWSRLDAMARIKLHRDVPFVIYYHRVVERFNANDGWALPAMEISVAMLERHLDWLGRNFQIVSLDDLDNKIEADNPSRPLAMVTFDDGYSDVYHHAFPLLKRKGISAGIFVITDLVGTSRLPMHEELHALLVRASQQWTSLAGGLIDILQKRQLQALVSERRLKLAKDPFSMTRLLLKYLCQADVQQIIDSLGGSAEIANPLRDALRPLSWEMLAEMRDAGMTIGSHSKTHPFLTNENNARIAEEVTDSRLELQRRLGVSAACFAYPGGGFDSSVVQAVAAAGYRYGFSICRHTDPQYPLLTLPRRGMWEQSSLDLFGRFSPAVMSCQIAGTFDWISKCTQAHESPRALAPRVTA